MGGMSAQIPIKDNLQAHEIAMGKVRADKLREVKNGHDGTWIAHPFLNNIALDVFNQYMLGPNQVCSIRTDLFTDADLSLTTRFTQYHVRREDVNVVAADLVNPNVPGKITSGGVYANVSAALAYAAAWLGGNGCIPLNHLMEDAATAEIARVQLWQWVKAGARAKDTGDIISKEYVSRIIDQVAKELGNQRGVWKAEDISLVVRYLKEQIGRQWPGEFLTSDLMDELAKKDGVDVKWLKSVL